jgi:type IV pilus assembly protein PilP
MRSIALATLGATLVGCGADTDELQGWMDQQRREVKPSVTPLTPPKKFDPAPYASLQAVEPFSNQKLSVALKQEAKQPNSLLAAELNRRKEPLEFYTLDGMNMVGSVTKQGRPFALLKVDNLLYQVKVGDYLGQKLLLKITETASRCARSFRMQPANGSKARHAAAAGEGAMNQQWRTRRSGARGGLRGSARCTTGGLGQNTIQAITSGQQPAAKSSNRACRAAERIAEQVSPAGAATWHGPARHRQRVGTPTIDINRGNLRSVSVAQAGTARAWCSI